MSSVRMRGSSPQSPQNRTLATLEKGILDNHPTVVKRCIKDGVDANGIMPANKLTPLQLALEMRNVSMMQQLLDGGAETERKGTDGSTVLTDACRIGYLEGVMLLAEHGANLNNRCCDGTDCLRVALEYGHPYVVAYLLEQDTCQVNRNGKDGRCFLQRLVLADDAQLIFKLKNRRIELNERNPDGTVPVFFATKQCKNHSLHGLLEAGADPNIGTSDGDFALHEAVRRNNARAVRHLMAHGADSHTVDKGGLTPAEVAIKRHSLSMLTLLLECGANIEQSCIGSSTPLIAACETGYMEAVQLLVESGANVYAKRFDRTTCLHAALERRHYSVVAYLLRHEAHEGSLRSRDDLNLLQHLILTDDGASMSNLKHCEVDLNASCPDGTMLVIFAIKHCKNKALKGLLQAGADPNVQNADGHFAICEAVQENNTDAVKHLIEHGADTHLKDKVFFGVGSPIKMAIFYRSLAMVRLLLDSGADIEQSIVGGSTLLMYACAMGYLEGVQLLVERGANLLASSTDGKTCLLAALEYENHSVVDYLLDQDVCEVNGIGRDGFSALHHAVLLNNPDLICKLIQKQADVNIQSHDGEVPVYLAVVDQQHSLLRMLLEAGADPNIATKDGDFALHEAVKQRNVEAVKLLLLHGADKDRIDKNGVTAVQVAVVLLPPPQDIIHCLLTDYMDKQDHEESHPMKDHVEATKKIFDAEVEQSLCCPITFEIMKDPVIASDGHTYERQAIEEWIRGKKESPVTRQPMTSTILIPNLSIKHLIAEFANIDSNP